MINQTPISARIYNEILDELEKECQVSGRKRNWIINQAIRLYIDKEDTRRMIKTHPSIDRPGPYAAQFLRRCFPDCV